MKADILKYFLWSIGVTIWLTICFILPYFLDSPAAGLYGILTLAAYISACGIGTFFIVYFVGGNRILSAIILPLMSMLGAALSFYLIGYHSTLTPMLIDVILHTNGEEAIGVMSWQLFLWIFINVSIAIVFIWIRWTRINLPNTWIHMLLALVLGIFFFNCNGRLKNSLCQRFPYNIPYTIHEYASLQEVIKANREVPPYQLIEPIDSLTIVFVIGEAARADHLQLNGYNRETNPLLSRRDNIVSFPYIYSEQTHTLASLPYIFTRADSTHESRQYSEKSFISIFRETGYYTAWISNQDLGSTFSPFINECDTARFANAGKSVYVFTQWIDEDLLPIMNTLRTNMHPMAMYILHTIGSHWYYNNHVPDKAVYFQPTTTNKVVTGNSIEQLVNSYDNTIRYMDYFLDSVISTFENEKAIVIYQSDHGEALGEDGEFLHANDAPVAKNPACVIWYSDSYAKAYPEKIKALVANKDKRYRTDYLFYSILYAAGIEAEGDNEQINIFR